MEWKSIDTAPMHLGTGTGIGGDGSGDTWSLRFVREDDPLHTVDMYVYTVDAAERYMREEDAGVWDVEIAMHCNTWDGPHDADDSTVIDSIVEYDQVNDLALSREQAEREAESSTIGFLANGATYIGWSPNA